MELAYLPHPILSPAALEFFNMRVFYFSSFKKPVEFFFSIILLPPTKSIYFPFPAYISKGWGSVFESYRAYRNHGSEGLLKIFFFFLVKAAVKLESL